MEYRDERIAYSLPRSETVTFSVYACKLKAGSGMLTRKMIPV